MADNHAIYKNGAKELAHLNGLLDHVHGEARPHVDRQLVPHPRLALARRRAAFADDAALRRVPRGLDRARAGAGGLPRAERSTRTSATPRARGRRRRSRGANDNRTCGFRVVGHGRSQRVETRIPGGDVNPYLAFAALLAAGLHGIERGARAAAGARGERVRVRRRAVPVDAARGDRGARAGHDRARRARRRRRRPLPQLRAHRAAALRRGRHVLRARAAVRAWLSSPQDDGDARRMRTILG